MMHLLEMSSLRTVPGAGVFMALTPRCPLSCAHCSTESSLAREQYSDQPFRSLVDTFTTDAHPEILALSGGEALLRPKLVGDLAARAGVVGCRTYLLSGMFFARSWVCGKSSIPPAIARAIQNVDHFAASLDEFHEVEVSRREVFAAIREVQMLGPSVSFQLTGRRPGDPYLDGLVADIRAEFADSVPILVGFVKGHGRARHLDRLLDESQTSATANDPEPAPCDMASWPLVTYDGTVLACCNQQLVDAVRPPHLILGTAGVDSWETLVTRQRNRASLRGVRCFGPNLVKVRAGGAPCGDGYCDTCVSLSDGPEDVEAALGSYLDSPSGRLVEELIGAVRRQAPAVSMVARRSPGYEALLTLGSQEVAS